MSEVFVAILSQYSEYLNVLTRYQVARRQHHDEMFIIKQWDYLQFVALLKITSNVAQNTVHVLFLAILSCIIQQFDAFLFAHKLYHQLHHYLLQIINLVTVFQHPDIQHELILLGRIKLELNTVQVIDNHSTAACDASLSVHRFCYASTNDPPNSSAKNRDRAVTMPMCTGSSRSPAIITPPACLGSVRRLCSRDFAQFVGVSQHGLDIIEKNCKRCLVVTEIFRESVTTAENYSFDQITSAMHVQQPIPAVLDYHILSKCCWQSGSVGILGIYCKFNDWRS